VRLNRQSLSPRATFSGVDLYPEMAEKATALCFALIQGHPFVDGNKRAGHAAMETFLILSGAEIEASVEDQERLILAGRMGLSQLTDWLRQHLKSLA
jgi:death-on-curing protein